MRYAILCAGSLLVASAGVALAEARPAWIPPDGGAGPVVTLSAIKSGAVGANTMITTQTVTVSSVSCPSCESPTVAADFTIRDSTGTTVRVHDPNTWQATWNVKKQNWLPTVGQSIVVQGVTGLVNGERLITLKRFSEIGHGGASVHAYDVAAGKVPAGSYVWLDPVIVLNRAVWDDGDHTFDVRDPAGGGMLHVELSPPFAGQLHLPNKGDTVTPYGRVHFDSDNGWWEIHPVRCWSRSECVPTTAGFVQNGPPAGTPSSSGFYEQGGPVPLFVPMGSPSMTNSTGSSGPFSATFSGVSGNNWWVQASVSGNQPVASVCAKVNGGTCQGLTHQSWGAWAASFFVATGSTVQFVAMSSSGGTAASGGYAWPSATPTSAPSGGGSSGASGFTATFSNARGNEWWVEIDVRVTGGTLAGVDASLNGGGWIALDHTSWGSWAKGIHASEGTSVTFRARSTAGAAVVSSPFPWIP